MPDEILNNPEYLSACVMKHLIRGQLDKARYYLERLMELQKARDADGPFA